MTGEHAKTLSGVSGKLLPPVRKGLIAGIDAGGTKVHIADTYKGTVRRYSTAQYASLEDVLREYFQTIQARPTHIMIGMAGPRDDDTGVVKFTNLDWPAFNPKKASKQYGITIETANDMVVTMAGILHETGIDLLQLKAGTPTTTGAKLAVTVSTGIGTASAVWDARTKRYVIGASEGGHIGLQPRNDHEHSYVARLHTKYPYASAELALSGKHGVENLVEHMMEPTHTPHLAGAIERARRAGLPIGTVLLEYATAGKDSDQQAARNILKIMGDLLGSTLRNLALTCKATGGIYLTGSAALGLGEYLAQQTDFCDRFVVKGATHDYWLQKVPIYLITNTHIATAGALALAQDMAA